MNNQSNNTIMQKYQHLLLPVLAMGVIIVASNILVEYPINDWLVWGALTYPFAFLVTDLTNRFHGANDARKVVLVGFAIGILASLVLADLRIALASGTAFLIAQLCDVSVFDRLRRQIWWVAPLLSSALSTILDTGLFFGLAFGGSGEPWMSWAVGDLMVKWGVALIALIPYRLFSLNRVAA